MAEKVAEAPRLDRPLRAEEVEVQVVQTTKDWALVRLWPRVDAVRGILEDVCRDIGIPFALRHYACGRAMYCGLGMPVNSEGDTVFRDACEINEYHLEGNSPAQDACDSSFLASASLWSVGVPVMRMPPIRVGADRVQINPVEAPVGQRIMGYAVADTLTCTGLAIEAGTVSLVQLTNGRGEKIVWQRR